MTPRGLPDSCADLWSRWPAGQSCFAVVDAAQDATFLLQPDGAAVRRQSLYSGGLGALLDDVAPHLVEFQPGSAFGDWFAERLGAHVGILLRSGAPFEATRKHLRRFTLVEDEARRQFRFRFYDPRVLRAFLPACNPDEARRFFGPIQRLYAPHRQGISSFACTSAGVQVSAGDEQA